MWHCTLDLYGFTRTIIMPDEGGHPPLRIGIAVSREMPFIDWDDSFRCVHSEYVNLFFKVQTFDKEGHTAFYTLEMKLSAKRKESEIGK